MKYSLLLLAGTTLTTATATSISLITFDGAATTTHTFSELNDPVMGGKSVGTFKVSANRTGVFTGTVNIVPKLKAPGFIEAWADDSSSWIRRVHEVHAPSAFTRCHDELIALSEDGAVASKVGSGDYTYRTAASGVAMRGGGRYYAAFTIVKYVSYTLFGIIRPWAKPGLDGELVVLLHLRL